MVMFGLQAPPILPPFNPTIYKASGDWFLVKAWKPEANNMSPAMSPCHLRFFGHLVEK